MSQIPRSTRDHLDALLRLGAAGDLSDGQLLERLADPRDDDHAGAAFAVLVERHGPMVLRVCRDVVGDPHDAEDAFQATFLVLARQSRSVRSRDSAASWLFGVARRVSARARRQAARRRESERRKAEVDPPRLFAPEPPESWEELHEEVDRLPAHERSAVVLCHLEGLSHEEAATRLACPVRTLQSRLLRGRARLRDRLTRRGVAPGVLGALGSNSLQLPTISAPLVAATARVVSTIRAGTVPAAVASLANGVLSMTTMTCMKSATAALTALALAAGLAWAVVPRDDPPKVQEPARAPAKANTPAVAEPEPPKKAKAGVRREPLVARGVVVDPEGRPVAGARVGTDLFTKREAIAVSGADGSFAIPLPADRRTLDGLTLMAVSPGGDKAENTRIGYFLFPYEEDPKRAEAPARVVLKPAHVVTVHVVDESGDFVTDAVVEASLAGSESPTLMQTKSFKLEGLAQLLPVVSKGEIGNALLVLPEDASITWIAAYKPRRGFDYAGFGGFDKFGYPQTPAPVSTLPKTVVLKLDGARTAQIRAVDPDGKPVPGVEFAPAFLARPGRKTTGRDCPTFSATTGADGIATFDWLPKDVNGPITVFPRAEGYAERRVGLPEGQAGPIVARVVKNEEIRGRVTFPDGTPAPGIAVSAFGTGVSDEVDEGTGSALTDEDGNYRMSVPPGEGYAVWVEDEKWAARRRLDVIVRRGKPASGVDFRLVKGTVVRGTITFAPDNRPAPDQAIGFHEVGGQGPLEVGEDGRKHSRQIRWGRTVVANIQGDYSILLGPGTYSVYGPTRGEPEEREPDQIIVDGEAEIVRDFKLPRAEKATTEGRVIDLANGRPVPGATVEIMAISPRAELITLTADADGRFATERMTRPLVVHARNPAGTLAAIVDVGPEDPTLTIAIEPTASASGRLVAEDGAVAANQKLFWGRRVMLNKEGLCQFLFASKEVTTDAEGRFTLPGLVVGQEYEIMADRNGTYPAAGTIRPDSPIPHRLGTIRVGALDERRSDEKRKAKAKAGEKP